MEKDLIKSKDNTPIYLLVRDWIKNKKKILTIVLLVLALNIAFFWNMIVITIEPGQAGILFKRFSGTKIDTVYGEGLHVFSPWDTLYIYEVRKQLAFHEFDILSVKGLRIHLSLAIRYRPQYELLGILHKRIGPDYLNRVIIPQIESVMRKELGNYRAEEIYTNKEGLLTNAILTALEEVGRNYVEVEDIIIRSLTLPKEIVKSIEDKLQQEEFMKSYEFRILTAKKEAERLKIKAEGLRNYNKVVDESLSESILRHKGIEATKEISTSNNAKIVIIGSGKDGLPLILGNDSVSTTPSTSEDNKKITHQTPINSTISSNIEKDRLK